MEGDLGTTVIRAGFVYIFLLTVVRLMGKRTLGRLTAFDRSSRSSSVGSPPSRSSAISRIIYPPCLFAHELPLLRAIVHHNQDPAAAGHVAAPASRFVL